jgi:hypothetical protein
MTSAIDVTKPVYGAPTTDSVRLNFTTAKNEITNLQDVRTSGYPFLPLAGGSTTGAIVLYGDPRTNLEPATKQYVDNIAFGTAGTTIPDAPKDGWFYGRGGAPTPAGSNDWSNLPIFNTLRIATAPTAVQFSVTADATYNIYGLDATSSLRYNRSSKQLDFLINSSVVASISGTAASFTKLAVTSAPVAATDAVNKAYSDTKLSDALSDGNGYLRRNGAWALGVPQLDATTSVAVSVNATSGGKIPVITGSQTPYNSISDGLGLFVHRLSDGSNNGPGLWLWGSTATLGTPNTVSIYTGSATAGYQQWDFGVDGSLHLPGAVSINAVTSDPLSITAANGQHARATYTVTGVRKWSLGVLNTGSFAIADETGAKQRMIWDAGHNTTIYDDVTISGSNGIQTGNHFWKFDWDNTGGLGYIIDGTTSGFLCTQTNAKALAYAGGSGGPTGVSLNGYTLGGQIYGIYVDVVSDERIKEYISPTDIDALTTLLNISVDQFDIKATAAHLFGRKPSAIHIPIGLVAQKVQRHIPEAVNVLDNSNAPEGSTIPSDMHTIIDANFTPYLIRSIQQLAGRVMDLENRR